MDFKFPVTATMLVPLNEKGETEFEDFWQVLRDGRQQPRDAYPQLGPKNAQGQFEMPFFLFVTVFGGPQCISSDYLQKYLSGELHIKV